MQSESLNSFRYQFSNFLVPNYFQIKNTRFQPLNYNGLNPLQCELYCKFIPETNNSNDALNFILVVNFFKTVKIPLSFIMKPLEKNNSNLTNLMNNYVPKIIKKKI